MKVAGVGFFLPDSCGAFCYLFHYRQRRLTRLPGPSQLIAFKAIQSQKRYCSCTFPFGTEKVPHGPEVLAKAPEKNRWVSYSLYHLLGFCGVSNFFYLVYTYTHMCHRTFQIEASTNCLLHIFCAMSVLTSPFVSCLTDWKTMETCFKRSPVDICNKTSKHLVFASQPIWENIC